MKKYMPYKPVSANAKTKPWVTREIISRLRNKVQLYRKWKSLRTEESHARFKAARSACQRIIRKSHDAYTEEILADGKCSKFWHYIKSKRKDSCSVAPLRENGVLISDAYGKANILNRQYCSVFNPDNRGSEPSKGESCATDMPPITVTATGVKKMLESLKPNKAAA